MKIYTSYFAKIRSFPENLVPVSIALKQPAFYTGLRLPELAPTQALIQGYKYENKGESWYVAKYKLDVIAKTSIDVIFQKLMSLGNGQDVALICYESSSDFCHRFIASAWMKRNGIDISEFGQSLSTTRSKILSLPI